jgi:hypothetical protein
MAIALRVSQRQQRWLAFLQGAPTRPASVRLLQRQPHAVIGWDDV